MSVQRVVIVGAGLAGAKGAEALRDNGFEGEIVLIGDEHDVPYERPPLSKDYLMGRKPREDSRVHPPTWYGEHDVDLRLGVRATGINRELRIVALDDGESVGYDKLLLATGSRPRVPNFPGVDARGVHYLRRLGDAESLRELFGNAERLAVVGGGWIGLEVAAAARDADVEVTLVEPRPVPLLGALGPEMGQVFAELHRRNGVELRLGVEVDGIEVRDGVARGLVLSDDSIVTADAVLVAVGAVPNVELASGCGLAVDGGVLTGATLLSSDENIAAVGDIAAAEHPVLGRRIRVEHWANALKQPAVAARNLLGDRVDYADLPYFFTDQYDLGMEYVGHVPPDVEAKVVVRGDVASGEFVAFWTSAGRVLAGMNVNVWDVVDDIKSLILSGQEIAPQRLADEAIPLGEL